MAPTRHLLFWFFLWALVLMPVQAVAETTALLIGIDRYDHLPAAQQLAAPAHDVRRLRSSLVAAGVEAGHIQELTGRVPLQTLREALDQLAQQTRSGDAVLIYYSGHGGRRRGGAEADGLEEGLVASDGHLDAEGMSTSGLLADTELLAMVDHIRAKGGQVWLVVDACYAAGVVRGGDRRKGLAPAHVSVRQPLVRPSAAPSSSGRFTAFFAASPEAAALERPARDGVPAVSYFTEALARAIDGGRLGSYRDLAAGLMAQDGRLGLNAPRPEFYGDLDHPVLDLAPGRYRRFAVTSGSPARLAAGREEGLAANQAVLLEGADGSPLGAALVLNADLGLSWLDRVPTGAVAARLTARMHEADDSRASRLLSAVQALGGSWQSERLEVAGWVVTPEAGCSGFVDPSTVPEDARPVDLLTTQAFDDCDILILEARNKGTTALDINLLYAGADGTVVTPDLYPDDTPRTSPGATKRVALRLRADGLGGDRMVVIATPVRSRFALDLRYLAGTTQRGEADDLWFAQWLEGRRLRASGPMTPPATASVLAVPVTIRDCDRECKAGRDFLP